MTLSMVPTPQPTPADGPAEGLALRQFFTTAEEALFWAAELLRKRRLPQLAGFWKSLTPEMQEVEATLEDTWRRFSLPQDYDDRLTLALQVEKALDTLARINPEGAQLLRWLAWGDWAEEARLQRALRFQEHCRQKGMRVRISYRYTYAQLGLLLGCDKKTAWRRVQAALQTLQDMLDISPESVMQSAA